MTLNPVTYTEGVFVDFLRCELTTYPFADGRLYPQMRTSPFLVESRQTPLLRGSHVSPSRSFRQGFRVSELITEGLPHSHLRHLVQHPTLCGRNPARQGQVV